MNNMNSMSSGKTFPSMELDLSKVDEMIAAALAEDLLYGPDTTTLATVGPEHRSEAKIVSRKAGTIAGIGLVERVIAQVSDNSDFSVEIHIADGERVRPGGVVASVEANTRDLLTAERTLLNIVSHMSGIATATSSWVDEVEGTKAKIRDSRKTLPGLRMIQKYSVVAGGGVNHRLGLGDRAMIKDNHVVAAGGVVEALRRVRAAYPDLWCEVEVDSLKQLDQVLAEKPEEVLLDNFEVWETQIAVQRRDAISPDTLLESSGGLSLESAADYARCGVDFLAVGALTHSVVALDLGLDFS